jgi:F-type H+-transporting ATPase subunit alpha
MTGAAQDLETFLAETFSNLDKVAGAAAVRPRTREVGRVRTVGNGIALVAGLPGVKSEELIRFPGGLLGMAFNVDPAEVGVILLGETGDLRAGAEARCTGRVLDVPVGEALLGRVVDALGRPLDNRGPIRTLERRPVEREAPRIIDRAPVSVPLQTGLKVVDALVPVGRGQRELILGDRQTGKTAIVLDTLINQKDTGVLGIYCAIGQRDTAVAQFIADLREQGVMDYCTVVVAPGEAQPGLNYVAPYAATSMGEYFMEQGRDVLVIYDNLSNHAHSYRELSLLLRRPPGREAYPGDIFYIHSRLLERSTHLRPELGGGSLTALPVVQTEAQNIAAYIPTNLISITDGQIYLTPGLFQRGIFPAVDVGKSVSRVGGKAQLPAYRSVTGDLRLSYSQFQELEAFSRFGTRLDERTRQTLEHGYRVREILKQSQFDPISVARQIAVLLAVTQGLFDQVPLDKMAAVEKAVRALIGSRMPELCRRIEAGEELGDADRELLISTAREAIPAAA